MDFDLIEDVEKVIPKNKHAKKLLPIVAVAGVGGIGYLIYKHKTSNNTAVDSSYSNVANSDTLPNEDAGSGSIGNATTMDTSGLLSQVQSLLQTNNQQMDDLLNQAVTQSQQTMQNNVNGQLQQMQSSFQQALDQTGSAINNLQSGYYQQQQPQYYNTSMPTVTPTAIPLPTTANVPTYNLTSSVQQSTGVDHPNTSGASLYVNGSMSGVAFNQAVNSINKSVSSGAITQQQATKTASQLAGLGNNGVGYTAASGQANTARLQSDASYKASEVTRTNLVIANRTAAGLDTSLQTKYLKTLK